MSDRTDRLNEIAGDAPYVFITLEPTEAGSKGFRVAAGGMSQQDVIRFVRKAAEVLASGIPNN